MALERIWKFPLERTDRQTVLFPSEYSILSVDLDASGNLCIWAAVGPEPLPRGVEICIVGTGYPLPHVGDFIGTVNDGPFMWHVFTGPGDSANKPVGGAFHYLSKKG